MSLREIETSGSDADEASDSELQRLRVVGEGHVSVDQRRRAQLQAQALQIRALQARTLQAQIQAQAHTRIDRPINVTNYGHIDVTLINNPVQYIYDAATGHLGGHISMASPSSSRHRLPTAPNGDTGPDPPGPSETPPGLPETDEAAYIEQPAGWFRSGRCFSIWAPEDAGIHMGKFILLDTQNTEGRGIPVKTLETEELRQIVGSSTSYRTRMVLKPFDSMTARRRAGQPDEIIEQDPKLLEALDEKLLHVHMDEHAQQDVHPGTTLSLSVTHNIPFVKYKCIDHGMLDGESLDDLRFHYIQFLVNSWRLTRQAREYFTSNRQ